MTSQSERAVNETTSRLGLKEVQNLREQNTLVQGALYLLAQSRFLQLGSRAIRPEPLDSKPAQIGGVIVGVGLTFQPRLVKLILSPYFDVLKIPQHRNIAHQFR
jgi:hypothetical protein